MNLLQLNLTFIQWAVYCKNYKLLIYVIKRLKCQESLNENNQLEDQGLSKLNLLFEVQNTSLINGVEIKPQQNLDRSLEKNSEQSIQKSSNSSKYRIEQKSSKKIKKNPEMQKDQLHQLQDILKEKDRLGNSLLHTAALANDEKFINALTLINDLDPLEQNTQNKMAFQLALEFNNFQGLPHLIPPSLLNADPNIQRIVQENCSPQRKSDKHKNQISRQSDEESIEHLKSQEVESMNEHMRFINQSPQPKTITNQYEKMEKDSMISDLDVLVVKSLNKEGLFNEKEITQKFKGFRQSLNSFNNQQHRQSMNNTIGNEQTFMNHDESYYMVKRGKIIIGDKDYSLHDPGTSGVNVTSQASQNKQNTILSDQDCAQTVAEILRTKEYLQPTVRSLRIKE
eukprot:403353638